MKKIIVSMIAVGLLLSAAPLGNGREESVKIREDPLFNELEEFLEFEGITPEQIKESLSLVDGPKEQLLAMEDDSEEFLLPVRGDIKKALDFMMNGSTPTSPVSNGDTEYWAVLIGVDYTEYIGNVFSLPVDENAECMYKTLLTSDHWQADHIKVLTNDDATLTNIIAALLWLDLMDDGDDISLVYYAAHGYQLGFDLPPVDEEDEKDEILTTWKTGKNPLAVITDDLLTYLLDRLDSQGVAVIIDSCYSGGMIDSSQNGRVVMTCCRENESGHFAGWKCLGSFISEGYQGYADGDVDGMVSAEEAYYYAAPLYYDALHTKNNPTIDDRYPGELILTDVEFPPSVPQLSTNDDIIGQPGEVFVFDATSTDPESDTIRYGWNWRDDSKIDFKNFWGYNVEEWSGYYSSGDVCTMSHSWNEPGVYTIRVKSQDEHGAEIIPYENYSGLWTKPLYKLIPYEGEIVDQYQIEANCRAKIRENNLVQSFTPSNSDLTKIKLKLGVAQDYTQHEALYQQYPLNVSIRSNSSYEDLVKMSCKPYEELPLDQVIWVEFDFPDLTVTAGEEYYIVVSCDYMLHNPTNSPLYTWASDFDWENFYIRGQCFITYANDGESNSFQQTFITTQNSQQSSQQSTLASTTTSSPANN